MRTKRTGGSNMRVVTVREARAHLSRLLEEVRRGETILIVRGRTPVARLVPYEEPERRPLGFVPGRLEECFFEPLPEEELAAWEPAGRGESHFYNHDFPL